MAARVERVNFIVLEMTLRLCFESFGVVIRLK